MAEDDVSQQGVNLQGNMYAEPKHWGKEKNMSVKI